MRFIKIGISLNTGELYAVYALRNPAIDVNAKDLNGKTALILMASKNRLNYSAVRRILKNPLIEVSMMTIVEFHSKACEI